MLSAVIRHSIARRVSTLRSDPRRTLLISDYQPTIRINSILSCTCRFWYFFLPRDAVAKCGNSFVQSVCLSDSVLYTATKCFDVSPCLQSAFCTVQQYSLTEHRRATAKSLYFQLLYRRAGSATLWRERNMYIIITAPPDESGGVILYRRTFFKLRPISSLSHCGAPPFCQKSTRVWVLDVARKTHLIISFVPPTPYVFPEVNIMN